MSHFKYENIQTDVCVHVNEAEQIVSALEGDPNEGSRKWDECARLEGNQQKRFHLEKVYTTVLYLMNKNAQKNKYFLIHCRSS